MRQAVQHTRSHQRCRHFRPLLHLLVLGARDFLIMRLTIIILLLFPLLGAVSWAQTSSPMEASPNAVASPDAGQSRGMVGAPQPPGMAMGQPWMDGRHRYPPWFESCPPPRRSVRI